MTRAHHPAFTNPTPDTNHTSPSVTIELFGVPRLLEGARSITAAGWTLADLAADLVRRSPALAGHVLDAGECRPKAADVILYQGRQELHEHQVRHVLDLPIRRGGQLFEGQLLRLAAESSAHRWHRHYTVPGSRDGEAGEQRGDRS